MNFSTPEPNKPNFRYETVGPDSDGQRIDNYVLKLTGRVPKSLVYKWLRKKVVKLNGRAAKPSNRLVEGDRVQLPRYIDGVDQMLPSTSADQNMGAHLIKKLPILYEDNGLLILNKPSGMAVHGGSGISLGVIEILRAAYPRQSFMELVHRLDRDTSGCLMVAKKRSVLVHLHEALRGRDVKKHYLALVSARVSGEAVIRAPLHKFVSKTGERKVRVDERLGKPSITSFRVLESFECASLVQAIPITGRTHQIRVHAKQWCAPLAGDQKYSEPGVLSRYKAMGINRLFLHASQIEVPLPSGERRLIECELPDVLQLGLEKLRSE